MMGSAAFDARQSHAGRAHGASRSRASCTTGRGRGRSRRRASPSRGSTRRQASDVHSRRGGRGCSAIRGEAQLRRGRGRSSGYDERERAHERDRERLARDVRDAEPEPRIDEEQQESIPKAEAVALGPERLGVRDRAEPEAHAESAMNQPRRAASPRACRSRRRLVAQTMEVAIASARYELARATPVRNPMASRSHPRR